MLSTFSDFRNAGIDKKTDKIRYHGYHRIYPYFLAPYKNTPIKLVEIGVQNRGSIDLWREYFDLLSYWGVDIHAKMELEELSENIYIAKGDQTDRSFLCKLKKLVVSAEVIVDDGSHIPEHQVDTFDYLFNNLLSPGGVYIIEDIETSYWKRHKLYGYEVNYGIGHPSSIIEIFRSIVDSVNCKFLHGKLYTPSVPISHATQREIEMITFAYNSIIIVKKNATDYGDYYSDKYRDGHLT